MQTSTQIAPYDRFLNSLNKSPQTREKYRVQLNYYLQWLGIDDPNNLITPTLRQQSEEECMYQRMFLSYKVGLNKIYTEQEMELQKRSLSWNREYNLSFETSLDAIFNMQDIEAITSDPYDTSDTTCTLPGVTRWLGVDPGASTSAFGLVVIQWRDGKLEVVYELEEKHADLDNMRKLIHSLIQKYHICRVFVDGSSVFLVRQLCKDFGEVDCTLYDDETKDKLLMTTSCRQPMIHSVTFRTKHRLMLEQLHKVVSTHQIRIDSKFKHTITALRTATNKPNGNIWDLDKNETASNDVLDALRLSLLRLPSW